jgi:hypothetical protein
MRSRDWDAYNRSPSHLGAETALQLNEYLRR